MPPEYLDTDDKQMELEFHLNFVIQVLGRILTFVLTKVAIVIASMWRSRLGTNTCAVKPVAFRNQRCRCQLVRSLGIGIPCLEQLHTWDSR